MTNRPAAEARPQLGVSGIRALQVPAYALQAPALLCQIACYRKGDRMNAET